MGILRNLFVLVAADRPAECRGCCCLAIRRGRARSRGRAPLSHRYLTVMFCDLVGSTGIAAATRR